MKARHNWWQMLFYFILKALFVLIIYKFLSWLFTAWKVSKYGFFSGPYFPVFGLNPKIYSVSLRIQSKCRKIWTRKNSIFGHFSRSVSVMFEKGSIRKLRLISKFARHQLGNIITIHICPNILKRKDTQTMKIGRQLIECKVRNTFLPKLYRKWGRNTSFRPLYVFFKKRLYEIKASDQRRSFNTFW